MIMSSSIRCEVYYMHMCYGKGRLPGLLWIGGLELGGMYKIWRWTRVVMIWHNVKSWLENLIGLLDEKH